MAQGLIEALRHDHDEVRSMFARLEVANGARRRELFDRLMRELVRHEVAEEEVLRPVSKSDAGERIANARIKEESQAEQLLKELERLDSNSPEFNKKLARLRREVESHARAEETKEFPRVEKKETTKRLEELGKAYRAAKKAAPTRPHPSTPNTPTANVLAGPLAAVMDRARDAIGNGGKSGS
jgi:hemerythrin superfamily protein